MRQRLVAAGALVLALSSCAMFSRSMPHLASAQVAPDFDTYRVERVGLVPFQGETIDPARGRDLQLAFYSEFSRTTPFEIVLLEPTDLEEVRGSDAHRRGWYDPDTIIETARRFNLDAILFGVVLREQLYPPQELSTRVDMVAAETGLVIWSASVHANASDGRVRNGLELYFGGAEDDPDDPWELSLVSPTRFARFAAYQIASML